jgi:carotenoid cleavage dioxygenase
MNAYADGSRVVCDVGRHAYMWRTSMNDFAPAYLHRWTFDLATGSVAEQQLDDCALGFPRVDDRVVGLRHRIGWVVAPRPGSDAKRWVDAAGVVVKYDLAKGTSSYHDFGAHAHPDEFVFAEASTRSGEDEGWVMGYVYDDTGNTSQLVILDAARIADPPVATIELPRRVPHGFHGSWMRSHELPR